MEKNDTIGVIRSHRWIGAERQRARLEAEGVRIIVALDGKKAIERVSLEKLTRPGTVVKFVNAFLLADPKAARKKGGTFGDFLAAMKRLVCKRPGGREGVLVDLETGLSTDDPAKKRALIAVVKDQLARSGKGAKSAINGLKNTNRGRPKADFSGDELKQFKAIWRDTVEYPTWDDADAAFKEINPKFTKWRANKLWPERAPRTKK